METPRSEKRSTRHSAPSCETCQSMINGASANVVLVSINSPSVFRCKREPDSAAGLGCHCAAHMAATRKGDVHNRSRNVPVGAGLTICRSEERRVGKEWRCEGGARQ